MSPRPQGIMGPDTFLPSLCRQRDLLWILQKGPPASSLAALMPDAPQELLRIREAPPSRAPILGPWVHGPTEGIMSSGKGAATRGKAGKGRTLELGKTNP